MLERSDAVNWSTLKHMRVSPRLYRWRLDHPREDTEALKLGRALHAAVYEPETFKSLYVTMPRFHGGQNDDTARKNGYDGGKQAKAAWEDEHAEAETLTPEMYERVVGMRYALWRDPVAGRMIQGGFAEQPITWTDTLTGIECRGRVDHVNSVLSDLKSTRDASPAWFPKDVVRYGYHAQLAFYADGLEANGIVLLEQPALIAVESEPPHDVVVYRFTEDQLAIGRRVYRYCLDRLVECRRDDRWPGAADDQAVQMSLPAWAEPPEEEKTLTIGGEAVSW